MTVASPIRSVVNHGTLDVELWNLWIVRETIGRKRDKETQATTQAVNARGVRKQRDSSALRRIPALLSAYMRARARTTEDKRPIVSRNRVRPCCVRRNSCLGVYLYPGDWHSPRHRYLQRSAQRQNISDNGKERKSPRRRGGRPGQCLGPLVACGPRIPTHQARRVARHANLTQPRCVLRIKMSDGFASPRVNAARIKDFLGCGHPVRVTGKVLNVRWSWSPHESSANHRDFPISAVFRR
jgi:hypothetical protein